MSSAHNGAAPAVLRSPLRRVPAPAKVVGLVVLLFAAGVTPNDRLLVLCGFLAVAAALAAVALVEPRALLRRMVLDLPVAALAVAQVLADPGPGLTAGAALLLKATTGIVAVSAVAASTTVPELLDGLGRLGLPAWFVRMVGLAFRQVALLQAELDRLRTATALRRPGRGRRAVWGTAGRALGAQLVRATERADRLEVAVALRTASDDG